MRWMNAVRCGAAVRWTCVGTCARAHLAHGAVGSHGTRDDSLGCARAEPSRQEPPSRCWGVVACHGPACVSARAFFGGRGGEEVGDPALSNVRASQMGPPEDSLRTAKRLARRAVWLPKGGNHQKSFFFPKEIFQPASDTNRVPRHDPRQKKMLRLRDKFFFLTPSHSSTCAASAVTARASS